MDARQPFREFRIEAMFVCVITFCPFCMTWTHSKNSFENIILDSCNDNFDLIPFHKQNIPSLVLSFEFGT